MRVISGSARGFKLRALDGVATRPTADRIKEDLFNIISNIVEGSRFLDVFSGTGAVGIEALSRGAEFALFIDKSYECTGIIKQNLEHTRLIGKSRILNMDYLKALSLISAGTGGYPFDIVFLDPPYNQGLIGKTALDIKKNGILKDGGILITETAKGSDQLLDNGFTPYKIKSYKLTELVFYIFNNS